MLSLSEESGWSPCGLALSGREARVVPRVVGSLGEKELLGSEPVGMVHNLEIVSCTHMSVCTSYYFTSS